MGLPGKNTGVGYHFLLHGIFLTHRSNPGLLCFLHCRWILYQLSHQGSPDKNIAQGSTAGLKTPLNYQEAHIQQFLYNSQSVSQFSHSAVSDSLLPYESQHARPPCPPATPGVYSNSCPSSWRCHPTISSSVIPFSSCPQFFPALGSFPMSQLFAWGGQSTGVSASASVLPMNTQDWSPLGWTGWISLKSKGLSRVFSNTIVQKHQFFGAQLSSQSNSHIHTWSLEKP